MSDKQSGFAAGDFLAIFDAGRDASFILDQDGRILMANRTAIDSYGYSRAGLIHRNLAELSAEEQQNDEPDSLIALLKSCSVFKWRLRVRSGRSLPVEIISQPIVIQGRPVFYLMLREFEAKDDCEQVLSEKQRLLERIVETEPGTVYIFDLIEQENVYVNCHWLNVFGYSAEETAAMGAELYKIFHPEDLQRISEHHAAWSDAADEEIRSLEYRVRDKQGNWHWLLSRETPFVRDDSGRICQILGIAQDISERKNSESLLGIQNRILNLIAAGTPLVEVLTTLVRLIEAQCEGMLGSILLLDADGVHVHHGAAPSLPSEFVSAIDGQPIGPVAGSCGTAAYRKQPVYVEDINTDPLWDNYKDVALAHGLQACWSTPVFDSGGQVLGTFAMYYRNPGLPTAYHLEIINTVTHIAAIAISRYREEQALRGSEHRFATLFGKSLVPGVLVRCSDSAIVDANEAWQQLFGYSLEEVTGKSSEELNINRDQKTLLQNSSPAEPPVSVRNREQTLYNKSGKAISVITNINIVDIDGQDYAITTMLDITDRKLAEAKIQRLTQLYATLSQCNQAIVRCHSEEELLPQICRDAVIFGGMKMAWIGMIEERHNMVKPVAWFGDGTDYLETVDIILDPNNPKGRGPTASAILNDSPFWCQDFINDSATVPWHERGRRYGWGASASLPLHSRGRVIGTFNIYTEMPKVFDEAEQSLLIEMSADISFALDRFASEQEHRQTDAALKASEQHLRTIVETEPDSVQVLDSDCRLLEMNAAGLRMLEIDSIKEIVDRSLLDFIVPEYHHDFQVLHQHIMSGESDSLEFEIVGKQGTRRWLGTHAAPMRDTNGNITAVLAITRDISEQKRAEERIQYMANYDSLTGLPNRIQLEDHIKYGISLMKRSNGHLAVLFIDIDHFKDINDTLGHSIGDALLVIIAQRIKSLLREEDTASRMGGDEFIVVLPECDAKGAAKVAQNLLQVIAEPYQVDSYELVVSASIGIAVFPEDGGDLESLSKSADTAMYQAKNEGRDGYRFFTAEMQDGARRNMLLVNALRHALERDQFQVVYQPQVSISEHRIVGVEALLRWQHPELGQVSPGVFIPVAEDSRLILSIGEWVLWTAVRQLKQWLDKGYDPLVMAVNLSAVQFRHSGLPDSVSDILSEAGIAPEFLELELTEGVAMQDAQGVLAMMNQLTQKGVRMSIDDFGTGYSSLSYLKKYRAYKLKIDQSFVRDITTDAEDKAIVAAIISMAKNLGLSTIAEGVETLEQLNYLREQGCDEVQGYYFSKPLPAAEVEKLVAAAKIDPAGF